MLYSSLRKARRGLGDQLADCIHPVPWNIMNLVYFQTCKGQEGNQEQSVWIYNRQTMLDNLFSFCSEVTAKWLVWRVVHAIYLDLGKAFGPASCQFLIWKLWRYGVKEQSICWSSWSPRGEVLMPAEDWLVVLLKRRQELQWMLNWIWAKCEWIRQNGLHWKTHS